jgi:hypothetical protein
MIMLGKQMLKLRRKLTRPTMRLTLTIASSNDKDSGGRRLLTARRETLPHRVEIRVVLLPMMWLTSVLPAAAERGHQHRRSQKVAATVEA